MIKSLNTISQVHVKTQKKSHVQMKISPPQSPVPPSCPRHPQPLFIAVIVVSVLSLKSRANEIRTTKLILERNENLTNQVCLLVLRRSVQCLLHEDEVWLQQQT